MTEDDIQISPLPPPLDPTRLYSPSEVRQWKRDTAAHYDSKRAVEQAQARKKATASAPRMLSEDEEFALAVARDAERKAWQFDRDSQALVQAKAREAYLASSPETAEVMERNFAHFLIQFQLWANRGYEVNVDGPLACCLDLFHATLTKPSLKRKVAT